MPASSQARSRRWAVRPEQPSSGGTSSQRAPVVEHEPDHPQDDPVPDPGPPPLGPTGCSGGKVMGDDVEELVRHVCSGHGGSLLSKVTTDGWRKSDANSRFCQGFLGS